VTANRALYLAHLAVGICALCILGGCVSQPKPCVRGLSALSEIPSENVTRLAAVAPIVVVGVVKSAEEIGGIFTTADEREYPIQLVRISLSVERVLRGDLRGARTADIYSYRWVKKYIVKGKNVDYDPPHGRRVYFLARADGRLRCYQDIYTSFCYVWTGRHERIPPAASVPDDIARLLLTMGESPDVQAFAEKVSEEIDLARALVGRRRALELSLPLVHSPERSIASSSCLAVSEIFVGQRGCLERLVQSSDVQERMRAVVTRDLNAQAKREIEFQEVFRRDPASWLRHETQSVDWYQHLDALAMLTMSEDSRVRDPACQYMRTAYPMEYPSSCGRAVQ
jgi:hypothetical protein